MHIELFTIKLKKSKHPTVVPVFRNIYQLLKSSYIYIYFQFTDDHEETIWFYNSFN